MKHEVNFDLTIDFPVGSWLSEIYPDINAFDSWILYKTLTGIGCTQAEIRADRNSIIMLPHVSIVKNKHRKHQFDQNTFAIYGDHSQTSPKSIEAYLKKEIRFKKILTTPMGLIKLINAADRLKQDGVEVDLFADYFLLVDEGHKWVKDVDYREDMIPPMNLFFTFRRKGIVSATMLPFSDPMFNEHEVKQIKINPVLPTVGKKDCFKTEPFKRSISSTDRTKLRITHPIKKDILLIGVNNIANGLGHYLDSNPWPVNCIFFNSINGIISIIEHLGIQAESRIFCSVETTKRFRMKGINLNASDEFLPIHGTRSAKYNFFTSSFFNGLDMEFCTKPNIVIISDGKIEHSILDPYTDVLQILGRIRNGINTQLVHIYNNVHELSQRPLSTLEEDMKASKYFYDGLKILRDSASGEGIERIFENLMERLGSYPTLFQDGEYSFFKEDNYWNKCRVRDYYREPYQLPSVYCKTGLYNVTVDKTTYLGKRFKLKSVMRKYSPANIKEFAILFEELESIKCTLNYYPVRDELAQMYPQLTSAYDRMGLTVFEACDYNINKINQAVYMIDYKEGVNSTPLIDLIRDRFVLGVRYSRATAKILLQELYNIVGIRRRASAAHLEKYFDIRYINMGTGKESVSGLILLSATVNKLRRYSRP